MVLAFGSGGAAQLGADKNAELLRKHARDARQVVGPTWLVWGDDQKVLGKAIDVGGVLE
ncbi:hypothetical protein [Georgenia yuyongxinii]|uniref:hypothetical protein n=1 Tax=Georgenia yuyongxinii TaxID=2589797 RepID=UPI00163DB24C|nr:hypothetical protein [Georgenia yuyongxinii]